MIFILQAIQSQVSLSLKFFYRPLIQTQENFLKTISLKSVNVSKQAIEHPRERSQFTVRTFTMEISHCI